MKKVVKFGGSSLADSEQFKKVGAIIKSDPSRVYVIPSAPGKRFSGDEKVEEETEVREQEKERQGGFDSDYSKSFLEYCKNNSR